MIYRNLKTQSQEQFRSMLQESSLWNQLPEEIWRWYRKFYILSSKPGEELFFITEGVVFCRGPAKRFCGSLDSRRSISVDETICSLEGLAGHLLLFNSFLREWRTVLALAGWSKGRESSSSVFGSSRKGSTAIGVLRVLNFLLALRSDTFLFFPDLFVFLLNLSLEVTSTRSDATL